MDYMDYSIVDVLVSVAITATSYLVAPFILSLTVIKHKKHTEKDIVKIAVINAVVIFVLWRISINAITGDAGTYSFGPALLWGTIGSEIMHGAATKHGMLKAEDRINKQAEKINAEAMNDNGLTDDELRIKGAAGPKGYGTSFENPIFTKNIAAYLKRLVTVDGKPIVYSFSKEGKFYNADLNVRIKLVKAHITVDCEGYGDLYFYAKSVDVVSYVYPDGYKFAENSGSLSYAEEQLKKIREQSSENKVNKVNAEKSARMESKLSTMESVNTYSVTTASKDNNDDKIAVLDELLADGIITQTEYNKKRESIVSQAGSILLDSKMVETTRENAILIKQPKQLKQSKKKPFIKWVVLGILILCFVGASIGIYCYTQNNPSELTEDMLLGSWNMSDETYVCLGRGGCISFGELNFQGRWEIWDAANYKIRIYDYDLSDDMWSYLRENSNDSRESWFEYAKENDEDYKKLPEEGIYTFDYKNKWLSKNGIVVMRLNVHTE